MSYAKRNCREIVADRLRGLLILDVDVVVAFVCCCVRVISPGDGRGSVCKRTSWSIRA